MHTKQICMVAAVLLAVAPMTLAQKSGVDSAQQMKLVDLLKSNAPKADKAVACKQLAVYGGADAVPALAPLLEDRELSSWARIALEVIPGPEADAALRDAMKKVEGGLLVGVINSIGVRRDVKAVDGLIAKLKESDKNAAAAAAIALGRIGGETAAMALEQALAAGDIEVRSAAAEGGVLVAEAYLASGRAEAAVKLYDTIRKADVPRQRVLEATRGAILARGAEGVPLLLEQLRSVDKGANDIALRTARELRGDGVTSALIAQMGQFIPERQAQLLLALADREDAGTKVLPVAVAALMTGAPGVRVTAAMVLERLGDTASVRPLVDAAAGENAELALAARTSLARLVGKEIDDAIFGLLAQSTGKMRIVLIELAEQRRIEGALPVFVKSAEDSDAQVRTTALVAIGAIGTDKQMADLVRLLQKASDADRPAIERAINSIGGRWGAASVTHLVPLTRSEEAATRIAAVRALAGCGGASALAAITSTLEDKEESVRDEAVRTLSTWPNRWPEDASVTEPLLKLAKSAGKPNHQILALRGYLQFVQGARRMPADQRLAKVDAALPLISRPEEKRLAISVLGAVGTAGALKPLTAFAADAAVAEEAYTAIVALASKNDTGISKEARREALQMAAEKSKTEAIKAKAQEAMKAIK